MTALCQFLEWDSAFFGYRIARVTAHTLTYDSTRKIMAWCAAERIDCLYFLSAGDDAETTRLAEAHGFAMTDIRVTLNRTLAADALLDAPSDTIRVLRPEDIPALNAIARVSFTDSRFYYDPRFNRDACAGLYERWIENSAANPDHLVLVADTDDKAVGFLICSRSASGTGNFSLMGVDAAYRRRGLAHKLVSAGLRWFRDQEIERLDIVTQGRNLASQRLYQRNGFLTSSVEVWYHRWFVQPT